MIWTAATTAAANLGAAPTPSAKRGPKLSATQPIEGAPTGVAPSAAAGRIDMTRLRMIESVVSWINDLLTMVNVSAVKSSMMRLKLKDL